MCPCYLVLVSSLCARLVISMFAIGGNMTPYRIWLLLLVIGRLRKERHTKGSASQFASYHNIDSFCSSVLTSGS